jgi:KUP system potassium uptake protein
MILWFAVMGILGIGSIAENPSVLSALNPAHAVSFFILHGWHSLLALSAVFLVLTGGEALYADMGHFGRRPIQIGWFVLVFPAVVLNYFGQGAHLLNHPDQLENLFYRLAPNWAMMPLLLLATVATIIASQAVISGAFSITRQAVQLGLLPRVNIKHTSLSTIGQIYVPSVNWALFVGIVVLLFTFQQSDDLAGAYGIAVSGTMLISTLMLFFFVRNNWNWSISLSWAVMIPFLLLESSFFIANMLKIRTGGWITILIAAAIYILITTWDKGHRILSRQVSDQLFAEDLFLREIETSKPVRVPGTAVFLAGTPKGIPRTLLHNFKHNKIIHKHVLLLTVITEDIPVVETSERIEVVELGQGFHRVIIRYGFSETPDIPAALATISHPSLDLDPMKTTFFLGRETLLPGRRKTMSFWRKELFTFMSRNSFDASKFFRIPSGRVVELGIQMEL